MQFQVGDRVRRNPKIWPEGRWPEEMNHGRVLAAQPDGDYLVKFDDGVEMPYHQSELVKEKA